MRFLRTIKRRTCSRNHSCRILLSSTALRSVVRDSLRYLFERECDNTKVDQMGNGLFLLGLYLFNSYFTISWTTVYNSKISKSWTIHGNQEFTFGRCIRICIRYLQHAQHQDDNRMLCILENGAAVCVFLYLCLFYCGFTFYALLELSWILMIQCRNNFKGSQFIYG